MSLLLPLTIHTTFLPFISYTYSSKEAIDKAPAGSTTRASVLYNSKIVEQTFPSGTKFISSKTVLQIEYVRSPTRLTAAPSTKRSIHERVTGWPASNAAFMEGAPSGSAPIIFVAGENVLK